MKTGNRIHPTRDLYRILQEVEQPARYVGGEYRRIVKDDAAMYRVALSFPDLYEIGMSNTAIKLIYGTLNTIPGVACERVFVPAPDFEQALQDASVPLYTLETGTPLNECDLLAVSFAYELLATNLVTLLKSGGIPIHREKRGENDPIVLLGGPGATNPAPYGRFADAIWQGEAENGFASLVQELATRKKRGASRNDLLSFLQDQKSLWYEGRTTPARRAIWNGFPFGTTSAGGSIPGTFGAGFPVPSIPVVQDHGVVEIMRGCPQGCRFCHAGIFYRPYRMKSISRIVEEVDWLVHDLGYREISLSSLSSGDYSDLQQLMSTLNNRYSRLGVSLQLPSLRVDSFTLPILEELNTVRRAGLTFAVESAGETAQSWTNKLVPLEKVIGIAGEARERGWRRAKLYFMAGLPGPEPGSEWKHILDYVSELRRAVPMEYVINLGTFIPKPHTPFQWEAQLRPETALEMFRSLKAELPRGTTLRYHDPWMSWLEGVLARGDSRVGEVIENAHNRGARLDAWTEFLKIGLWREAVEALPGSDRGLNAFSRSEPLPWDQVHSGVPREHLWRERERAYAGLLTERCLPECSDRCGVCNSQTQVRDLSTDDTKDDTKNDIKNDVTDAPHTDDVQSDVYVSDDSSTDSSAESSPSPSPGRNHQLLLEYEKLERAAFLPHLAVVRVFERLWNRIDLPVELSEGHHPKPKMSFGQPLPTGIGSTCEVAIVNLQNTIQLDMFSDVLFSDLSLPEGIRVTRALTLRHEHGTPRIPAPMQLYGGSCFLVSPDLPGEPDNSFSAFLDLCREQNAMIDPTGTGEYRVFLPRDAWGFGRILKESASRGSVRAYRIAILVNPEKEGEPADRQGDPHEGYPHEGGRHEDRPGLFDWYREIATQCIPHGTA